MARWHWIALGQALDPSTCKRADGAMGRESDTIRRAVVSDVEKAAGFQNVGSRVTSRASANVFIICEKWRL